MASASRRDLLAGLGALGAGLVVRSAHAAFPKDVQTSPGTFTSPVPPAGDPRAVDEGGYIAAERPARTTWTVSNAHILVGDGTVVRGGVRVEGGRIAALGPGVTGGDDLGGATVFPGFFDGGSSIGLVEIDLEAGTHDEAESSDGVVPAARVVDAYNPASALIPVARRQGVLGGLVLPSGGLVSGTAAWMCFAEATVEGATWDAAAGVVIQMGRGGTGGLPNQPKSRMGVALKLRELLDAHKLPEPPDPKAKKKKGEPEKPEELTRTQQVWRAVRERKRKVILGVDRADDILTAIALAREYGLDAVLLGAAEGHRVARDIAASKFPVLLAPTSTQPSGWDTLQASYANAARLEREGVPLVFRAGGPHNLRELPTEACLAVAYGLPHEAAVRAACGHNAAKVWSGLPFGTLAVDRPATLAVADGDPLQPRTRVLRAWIGGSELSLRSRQTTLLERFRTLR